MRGSGEMPQCRATVVTLMPNWKARYLESSAPALDDGVEITIHAVDSRERERYSSEYSFGNMMRRCIREHQGTDPSRGARPTRGVGSHTMMEYGKSAWCGFDSASSPGSVAVTP
jgi:hypothetical protein